MIENKISHPQKASIINLNYIEHFILSVAMSAFTTYFALNTNE